MSLFSRLFGSSKGKPRSRQYPGSSISPKEAERRYFELLDRIQNCEKESKYAEMLQYCEQSLPLLPGLIRSTTKEFGSFDISEIPAIELGCKYWSALGDIDSLSLVKQAVNRNPVLREGCEEIVVRAFDQAGLAHQLCEHIRDHPGAIQTDLGSILNACPEDIRELAYYLARLGRIRRDKSGRSYKLYLP